MCPRTGRLIDNSWVVPYNPLLSLRFNCHINVERCASPKAAKYLYKYVTKGSDRAMVATEVEGGNAQPRDEITEYEDLRSVGSSEATWHLMAFPISRRYPPVQALRVHTEDQQQVRYYDTILNRNYKVLEISGGIRRRHRGGSFRSAEEH